MNSIHEIHESVAFKFFQRFRNSLNWRLKFTECTFVLSAVTFNMFAILNVTECSVIFIVLSRTVTLAEFDSDQISFAMKMFMTI